MSAPAQVALFGSPVPPPPPESVILDLADAGDWIPTLPPRSASLLHADPPWSYRNNAQGKTGRFKAAEKHYGGLGVDTIAQHLAAAYEVATDDAYALVWCTNPILEEWFEAVLTGKREGWWPWRYVSAGDWTKHHGPGDAGPPGVGWHWRGDCEPLLLYAKGTPKPRAFVRNAHVSPKGRHSVKPHQWLCGLVEAFSDPEGTVVDLYAGLAPLARACLDTGRRYQGVELDPKRHAEALGLIAQHRVRERGGVL